MLVGRHLDGWLLGGFGVAAWLLFVALPELTTLRLPALTGLALWTLLGVSATHFGVSYHLAYAQRRDELRRHWLPLIAVPVLLVVFVAAVVAGIATDAAWLARGGPRIGLVAVYSLTTWHYVKQTYGVARLGATLHHLPIGRRTATVLRYGLYPLWLLEALAFVWAPGTRINDYGFDAAFAIVPRRVVELARFGSVAAVVVTTAALIALAVQWRRIPPATVWTPYAVAFLWIVWYPSHLSAVVVFGALHAVQYLACAHRAELAWGDERGETRRVVWWCTVFGGAFAGGMLLIYWLPMWSGFGAGTDIGITLAALVFIVFNLHHYAIDAAIWRTRDGHVHRITKARSPVHRR